MLLRCAFRSVVLAAAACASFDEFASPTDARVAAGQDQVLSAMEQAVLPPIAQFSVACTGVLCMYDASASSGATPIVSYAWNWGNGMSAVRSAPRTKMVFSSPGMYNVSLTVTDTDGLSAMQSRVDTISAEPRGMTPIAERTFDCTGPEPCAPGWFFAEGYAQASAVALDATAPKSPPGVVQQNFLPQLPGGAGPAALGFSIRGEQQKATLYTSMWMKLSSNFVGHPTSTNKFVHFWISGINRVFVMARGFAEGELLPAIGVQGLAAPYTFTTPSGQVRSETSANLLPNLAVRPIRRGEWHRYEMVFVANTPGLPDGSVELWLDGVKVLRYAGIMFAAAGTNARWESLNWNPTWGGLGGVITAPFFAQMDHIYISGK
jgi:PKD repeat protein